MEVGVLAYIKSDLSYNTRQDLSSSNEAIFFEIYLPNTKPILIGVLYRPPNDSNFFNTFHDTLENMRELNNQEFYIMGDMNIDIKKITRVKLL